MRLVTAAKEHCVEGEEGNLGCDIDAIVASSTERLANFIHLYLTQLLNVTRYQLEPNVENKVVKEFNIIAWSRHIVVLVIIVADHRQDQRIRKLSLEELNHTSVRRKKQGVLVLVGIGETLRRLVTNVITSHDDNIKVTMSRIELLKHRLNQNRRSVAAVATHWSCIGLGRAQVPDAPALSINVWTPVRIIVQVKMQV